MSVGEINKKIHFQGDAIPHMLNQGFAYFSRIVQVVRIH